MARRERGASERLDREDWIQAGFRAFAEGGLPAIRVGELASRLGVTKGSFYWHFQGTDEFLGALVQRWEDLVTDRLLDDVVGKGDPRSTLRAIVERLVRPGTAEAQRFEVAAAALADSHPIVRPAFVRITERRMATVIGLYRACGLEEEAARRLGRLAYLTLLGLYPLHLARGTLSEAERTAIIEEFCLRLVPAA